MILLVSGKSFNLEPHRDKPTWLVVSPLEINDFYELGVPVIHTKEGIAIVEKSVLMAKMGKRG